MSAAWLLAAASMSPGARGAIAVRLTALSRILALTVTAAMALAAKAWLAVRVSLSLRMTHRTMAVTLALLSAAIAVDAAAHGTAHRKVRFLAFWRLSLGARQRRADETPMHGPLVLGSCRLL